MISPVPFTHLRSEGKAGKMAERLMAVVAEGQKGRIYLSPTGNIEKLASSVICTWKPDHDLPTNPRDFKTPNYGMNTFGDLFTPRQLVALTTFSDLVKEAREKVIADAKVTGMSDDGLGIDDGGTATTAYGDAVAVYLAFAVDKSSVYWNTLCPWLNQAKNEIVGNSFGRQALPMVWDFAEANPFSNSGGNSTIQVINISKVINFCLDSQSYGNSMQFDATNQIITSGKVVSTDPPYYDNIGYADLSDFFYVWMRRSLRDIYPSLFNTIAVPKSEELIATPYRHGSKGEAELFFLNGMTKAIHNLADQAHSAFPVTIYYAFKQSETKETGTSSTGWETFLEAILQAGFFYFWNMADENRKGWANDRKQQKRSCIIHSFSLSKKKKN